MKISIQGLKQGVTRHSEKISSSFIEKPYRDFYPNDFLIEIEMDKFERDIRLSIIMESTASFKCDSCLTEYGQGIKLRHQQVYGIGNKPDIEDGEIIYLHRDTIELDLDSLLSEAVILAHPIKLKCTKECKGLCPGCGTNLNNEKCKCGEKGIDPRWEQLRKLIK
jgi:DUF177 domain-containing protein